MKRFSRCIPVPMDLTAIADRYPTIADELSFEGCLCGTLDNALYQVEDWLKYKTEHGIIDDFEYNQLLSIGKQLEQLLVDANFCVNCNTHKHCRK